MTRNRLALIEAQLRTLNPRNILNRGYSILRSVDQDEPIVSVRQVTAGQRLKAVLADGKLDLRVE